MSHALGLAAPLVTAVSTSLAAQKGLLIGQRDSFERAHNVDVVVFDKTGTLTEGAFGVTDVITTKEYQKEQVLGLAASLESQSEHPIAQGILEAAKDKNIGISQPDEFQSITGKGISGVVNGDELKVVSPGYIEENGIEYPEDSFQELSKDGKTVVFVLLEQTVIGLIALADKIRSSAKQAIKRLKALDVQPRMLTGDNKKVANWVSRQLGLDEVYAEVLPDEKADKIKKIRDQGQIVAMTGDGVNDAPALATADLGVAIGAGTDVAMETADVVLVRSNPDDVVSTLELSKATYRKMVQNLWWAAGYNIIAIPLAAGVLFNYGIVLSPAVGALLMSLSTVIVAVNARSLKFA